MRDRAIMALGADGVLTARQLKRYCGVDERALRGLPHKDAQVRPVHSRPSASARVRFYALYEETLRYSSDTALSHIAGVAAIRHQLGIPPEEWSTRHASGDHNYPDAEYKEQQSGRRIAVEYDSGTYVRQLVREKMQHFEATYGGVVWGVISRVRGERIHRRHPDARVVDATWWA